MSACLKAVAVPCYNVPGCHGWSYSSVIIAPSSSNLCSLDDIHKHHEDLVVAVNSFSSLSGCLALQATIAHSSCRSDFESLSLPSSQSPSAPPPPSKYFKRIDITGSHYDSLACVASSSAHIACIDCVTYTLLLQQQPDISRHVRVVARTPSAPCLPYCTSINASEALCDALFQALQAAAADPQLQSVRDALKITGFQRYSRVPSEATSNPSNQEMLPSTPTALHAAALPAVSSAHSPLPPASSSSQLLLCPYQVAVSRLFLRARGSGSVSAVLQPRCHRRECHVITSLGG